MKLTIVLCIILILTVSISNGQEEKSPTYDFLNRRGYIFPGNMGPPDSLRKWPDTMYYDTPYKSKLLGSPTIPISFGRVEFQNGKYQVTPTLSIGYGYAWFFGDFIFSENDKIIVDPGFSFGIMGDIGIQNNFDLTKPSGLFLGGFIGIPAITLFSGYDFLAKTPIIGLGTRVDLYTLSQNRLKPCGKVREMRKHKKFASMIVDE